MAELALGIVGVTGAVDTSIKLAKYLIETFRTYRDSAQILEEKIVFIEAIWVKVERQLNFLRSISDSLDPEFAESQFKLVGILGTKLYQLASRLENYTSSSGTESASLRRKWGEKYKRIRFSTDLRSGLDILVDELRVWSDLFDPSWYHISRISNNAIDYTLFKTESQVPHLDQNADPIRRLKTLRAVINPGTTFPDAGYKAPPLSYGEDSLGAHNDEIILYSAATAIKRTNFRTQGVLIRERIPCPPETASQVKSDVESLARRLQQVDPDTFGLLQCYGLIKHRDPNTKALQAIDAIYRTPDTAEPPTSLRQHLLQQRPISITAIVQLAKELIKSVSYIHACNFVHKNITPENILIFSNNQSSLGRGFLLGFDQFRNANFQTSYFGDFAWHRNLYRHPQRQGPFVQDRYIMQHDIYSIGVCLLEIGLWQSFVCYPDFMNADTTPTLGETIRAIGLQLTNKAFETRDLDIFMQIKDCLVALARSNLPHRMGDRYTDIVLACLTCLDLGNETFMAGRELEDEDGIMIGVRYIENILLKINDISV
ncbi:hypothetical protein TWF481_008348 [Arthrobotrys musiformis]|uniref:Protein kinase domain-containing protein n=1 Tax=Arthrobotrys musiformis TaxID=47236 RepID=A0AAV9W6U8_9PEZI